MLVLIIKNKSKKAPLSTKNQILCIKSNVVQLGIAIF
jgi:hypothetical protein